MIAIMCDVKVHGKFQEMRPLCATVDVALLGNKNGKIGLAI